MWVYAEQGASDIQVGLFFFNGFYLALLAKRDFIEYKLPVKVIVFHWNNSILNSFKSAVCKI